MTLTKKGGTRPAAGWGLAARGIPWEYAPAPESTDHIRIEPEYGLFIGNEFAASKPRKTFTVINPATEEPLAKVAHASKADVNRAVAAARSAYDSAWSRLPGSERAKYLYRIARILQERSREFAVVESMNSGKPIKESRDVDVPLAAAHFFYYAGWADKLDYAFPGRTPRALGVAAQVIRGTSRCSCWPGRSRPPWRRGTRSSSSRPRRRRSPRTSSPTSCARRSCRRAS